MELKASHVAQAAALADAGQSKEVRLRDSVVPGLCIRVRGRNASWHVMTRSQSLRLAAIDELSLKAARERARDVLSDNTPQLRRAVAVLLDAGIAPVDAKLIARGLPIDPQDKWVDGWTWNDAMSAFLREKQKELSARWLKMYKKYAEDDVLFPVQFQPLAKLNYAKLDLIRQEARRIYRPSRAKRIMAAAIDMLDWIWAEHRTEGGLHKVPFPWWRELTLKAPKSKKRFVPSIDVLARTLLILDRTPGLKRVHVSVVAFIVATGQRIDQVCSLKRSQIELDADGGGVIHWSGGQMKGAEPHALWVPADVLQLVAPKGRYAFPADEESDRPVRSSVINRWLANLWGRRSTKPVAPYKGKPGPAPGTGALPTVLKDAEIPYWTPHAVRSVLATELIDAMLDAAASAILSHKRPRTSDLPERPTADEHAEEVTLRHYSRAQRIPLKKLGMIEWHKRLRQARTRVGSEEQAGLVDGVQQT